MMMKKQEEKKRWRSALLLLLPLLVNVVVLLMGGCGASASTPPADSDCIQPLETLMDCLPYAQGKEAAPAPKCCSNMHVVYANQKKCLCELMAASFEGTTSGLPPFNKTLALHMPQACSIDADPAKCPALLGIPADSPEAKQFDISTNGTSLGENSPSSTSLSSASPNLLNNTGSDGGSSMSANSGKHTITVSPLLCLFTLFLLVHSVVSRD